MPELNAKEYFIDVKELETVKVVERLKEVVIPKLVQKEVVVDKIVYRDVPVERPVFTDKIVEVQKVKVNDLTAQVVEAIEKAVDEIVKHLIEKLTIKVDGSGEVKLKVEV